MFFWCCSLRLLLGVLLLLVRLGILLFRLPPPGLQEVWFSLLHLVIGSVTAFHALLADADAICICAEVAVGKDSTTAAAGGHATADPQTPMSWEPCLE